MIKPTEGMYSSLLQMKMELFRLKKPAKKEGRSLKLIQMEHTL